MATFSDAYAKWEAAKQEAEVMPTADTRLTAEQARWAVSHHPSVHQARAKVERGEQRRRGGNR